jgi:hypothetical protein
MKNVMAKNDLSIIVGNNEVLHIDISGNIGIGTCSPSPPDPEPLTEWYKDAVKQKGLVPHTKEQDGN